MKTKRKARIITIVIVALLVLIGIVSFGVRLYMKSRPIDITEANFPDKAFREEVSKQFDRDENGQLTKDEIVWAKVFKLNRKTYYSFEGVEKLPNLKELKGDKRGVIKDEVVFERIDNLEKVNVSMEIEKDVNICDLDNLQSVKLVMSNSRGQGNEVVNISNCSSLNKVTMKTLYTGGDGVSIKVTECPELSKVLLDGDEDESGQGCGIGNIFFERCEKLSKIDVIGTYGNNAQFGEGLEKLKEISMKKMWTTKKLDFSLLPALSNVWIGDADSLTEIKFGQDSLVRDLYLGDIPNLQQLSLKQLAHLSSAVLAGLDLKSMDFENNAALKEVTVYGVSGISKLTMNNKKTLSYFEIGAMPDLQELDLVHLDKLETLKMSELNLSKEFVLEDAPNIKELDIEGISKLDVDFSQLRNLQKLRLENCEIGEIEDVSKLKELYIDKSTFPLIDFSQMNDLEKIIMLESTVKKNTKKENVFDFRNLSKIKKIEIDLKNEVGVRWGRHKYLKNLSCWRGIKGVEVLDLKCFPNVEFLLWNCGELTKIKSVKGSKICDLDLAGNKLTGTLELSQFPHLMYLNINDNEVTKINGKNNMITDLYCKKNKIKKVIVKRINGELDCDPGITLYTTPLDEVEDLARIEYEYLFDKSIKVVYY